MKIIYSLCKKQKQMTPSSDFSSYIIADHVVYLSENIEFTSPHVQRLVDSSQGTRTLMPWSASLQQIYLVHCPCRDLSLRSQPSPLSLLRLAETSTTATDNIITVLIYCAIVKTPFENTDSTKCRMAGNFGVEFILADWRF